MAQCPICSESVNVNVKERERQREREYPTYFSSFINPPLAFAAPTEITMSSPPVLSPGRRSSKRCKLVLPGKSDGSKVDNGPLDGDDGDRAKGEEVLKVPERNKLLLFDKYMFPFQEEYTSSQSASAISITGIYSMPHVTEQDVRAPYTSEVGKVQTPLSTIELQLPHHLE